MANPGGANTKFVSVNLNKSYGPVSNNNRATNQTYGANRPRPGSGGGGGGGGGGVGGGMVVLSSRPRSSSQKPGPKLSVPPPLNLPSLRKEHERFDLSGSGGGPGGGGAGSSNATRPMSSGVGWTKPVSVVGPDTGIPENGAVDGIVADVAIKGSSSYMPPSARFAGVPVPVQAPAADRAAVLRGEDFPSLRAALPSGTSGPVQKLNQKQKQLSGDDLAGEQRERPSSSSKVDMRPQGQSSYRNYGNGSNEKVGESIGSSKKQEEPLPLVRLNPRFDWADDERDTGHGFVERSRDQGFSNSDAFWDREFDMPRNRFLPQKPAENQFQRWGKREDESGKTSMNEVPKVDSLHRDVRTTSREGNSWRSSPLPKDDAFSNGKNTVGGRTIDFNREMGTENRYNAHRLGEYSRDSVAVNHEATFGRRDGFGQEGRFQRYHTVESSNSRGIDRNTRDFYVNEQSNRNKGYGLHNNNSVSKNSFAPGGKGFFVNDPILNVNREKRPFSNGERTHPMDAYLGQPSFDEQDPFSTGLVGVIKRKKDVVKPADLHDPVRESFEAELERVQKMQEQERQRIVEEQERALEQARREEEERNRMIREEEEQRRRAEEAAREVAWRAEQEQLEAVRRAEELRIAREEEKRHMIMEEERRKQAAKQKLLELEARMAKRQAETVQGNGSTATSSEEKSTVGIMEKDVSRVSDCDNWEDNERMVQRIMTSGSSDSSSALNRSFELGHRSQSSRDGASSFVDQVKPVNSWRRDAFEGGNNSPVLVQVQNGHHSPRRDCGRAFPKKDSHGGVGYMPTKNYYRGGNQETYTENYIHPKGHKWNTPGDVMEAESEFHESLSENYGDVGWGQGHFRGNAHSPYPERLSSDGDDLYPYGRSRYSMRQPRVLPPPSVVPVQKALFRGGNERPGPSNYAPYEDSSRNDSIMQTAHNSGQQERVEALVLVENTSILEQMEKDSSARCDSQSSLSVSSPPSSPTHLSHDDLDESGDSPMVSATKGNVIPISDSDFPKETVVAASSLMLDADEDWGLENNEELQEQEEYDEDDDGYREEEEVREGDDLAREFEDFNLAEKDSLHTAEKLVLGFDEGVEVGLPSDDFERSPKNGVFVEQEVHLDTSPKMPSDSLSRSLAPTDNLISNSTSQPLNTDSQHLDTVDQSSSSLVCNQHLNPSSVDVASHSSTDQTAMPTVLGCSSPIDLPIQLQFGLFSGPPLIPSPVPAIQIGSIQMPLHLHPSMNPSLTQVQQSQAPLFQFGQLRYATPISQGIVPMASQLSFMQPNVPLRYNLNQNPGGDSSIQPKQEDLTCNNIVNDVSSNSVDGGSNMVQKNEVANFNEKKLMAGAADKEHRHSGYGNHGPSSGTVSKGILHSVDSRALKTQGPQSGFKSKRYAYVARNSAARSSFLAPDDLRSHSGGFQRRPRRTLQHTEFRVREKADDKSSISDGDVEVFVRNGSKRGWMANKSLERVSEYEPSSSHQQTNTDFRVDRNTEKESSERLDSNPRPVEVNLKRNIDTEEDVDAPLQSGIVRVFNQPGIEAPSDEDDFIQVRSKRQMLNDRREQREKEIKAKSRIMKAPRKVGSIAPTAVISRTSRKTSAPLSKEPPKNSRSNVVTEGRGLLKAEASNAFVPVSQPLAPIGTPAVTSNAQADKRHQITKSHQADAVADSGKDLGSGPVFETSNTIDDVQTSLGSWGNSQIGQQVMALTQTQLDEAMRPGRFDLHVTSTGGHSSSVVNAIMPPSSILTKDKSFSSTASPVNSLLAGEKIQFGAVTSPTVLPLASRVVSHGIRAPGSSRSDIQISHNLSASESDCSLLFEKDKHQSESCVHLEDCEAEAEAEAAASAVAVAAISSDESVGGGLGACSVSDTKSFRGKDINGVTGGMAGGQQLSGQSRAEESLSVALPADLSVETPPMSLWPPLPSPQNSSGQMLSHFPGGPSSPFPFYEMSPMLGAPIFAFGPQDESAGTQPQPQKSSVTGSGPLGAWHQFHSGADSFYGPHAGFPGPYIGPHRGIPGVQGSPHMVVYNHFPVGQFGQVGLSFMGTTYIPSGKQPDWKHNHATPAVGNREGDVNNMNMGNGQRNPPNMSSPVQHLPPPSHLLPMPSPLALFDVSPFQSAADMSVQGRWPHVPSSPLHSVPLSMPQQQQETGGVNSQIIHGHPPVDHMLTTNRFTEPRISTTADSSRTFPVPTDSNSAQFPDLVNPSNSSVARASTQSSLRNSSSGSTTILHVPKSDNAQIGSNINNTGHSMNIFKTRSSQQKNVSNQQQYSNNTTGYGYQRSRMGFHGRSNSIGADKSFPSKMKQIYVAKQNTNGATMG